MDYFDENYSGGVIKKIVNVSNVYGDLKIGISPEHQVDSAINELLKLLAGKSIEFDNLSRQLSAETIVKIDYNNLSSKSHIVKQYTDFSSQVEEAYSEIDSLLVFGKNTILRNLKYLYYSALDSAGIDYINSAIDINKVKEKSDFIFDFIVKQLRAIVFESKNNQILREHIDMGVNVVVAHAFIECIIMENPEHDTKSGL